MKRICVPEEGDYIICKAEPEMLFKVEFVDLHDWTVRSKTLSGKAIRTFEVEDLAWSGAGGIFYFKEITKHGA